MKSFIAVAALVLAQLGPVAAAGAPGPQEDLEWEIKVPVTLFDRAIITEGHYYDAHHYFLDPAFAAQDWRFRRELYVHDDCLRDSEPVYCSEQRLAATRIERMKSRARNSHLGNSQLAEAYLSNFSSYWLWYRNYHQQFLREILNNPVRAQVRLSRHLASDDGDCVLLLDGKGASPPRKCTDWFDVAIPRGSSLRLTLQRVADAAKFHTDARVRQITVLGLGDSFASGEGSPDIPATLTGRPDPNAKEKVDLGPSAAQWLERNCHRSLLGPQARAIMQYAAANPHTEVNFIYVPCSGAEIVEGILEPYLGANEHSRHTLVAIRAGHKWLASLSQLNQVMFALCKDPELFQGDRVQTNSEQRMKKVFDGHVMSTLGDAVYPCGDGFLGNGEIDAVLLSVGGNDARFFSVVKHALFPAVAIALSLYDEMNSRKMSWSDALLGARGGELDFVLSARQAIRRATATLPAKYRKLDEAFETHLKIHDGARIIIAAYPNPNRDENGKLCNTGEGLESFDILGDHWSRAYLRPFVNRGQSADIEKFTLALNKVLSTAPHREGRQWTVAAAPDSKFAKRGWCAKDQALATSGSFNPFAETARLFRTPNDGRATQNQIVVDTETMLIEERSGKAGAVDARFKRLIATYGLFHPTNFGAAILADAYLKKLKCVLDRDCAD
jgi:hypothetical protein